MRDGGGGGVVLIDPDSLRRAASRLKGIAGELNTVSFGDDVFPAMPPGVLAVVQEALAAAADTVGPTAPDLEATVVELTRRAFWAEYADAMSSGYVLTGPAAQEFYGYLRDGTLMRYATPDEAAAAGKELALLSQGFRDDQSKLFLMAASLKGVEGSAKGETLNAFCGAFVNQFGAKNVELVPRVIQAMEYGRPIAFGQSTDPLLLRDVARNWTDQKLQTDPLDLIAPLSLALANATVARSLTSSFEDEIANSKDTWSTAALLSTGVFEKSFLLKCFQTGVVQQIADDSRYYSVRAMGETAPVDPYALGRFYTEGKGGLPVDTKSIVLDALARNPAAAEEALQFDAWKNGPVQVFDRMGNQVPVEDPLTLIYQYGHFDDNGTAFGHAYVAATDYLAGHDRPGGTELTRSALTNLLDSPQGGMSTFKDAIGTDLGAHHIQDLFDSAVDDDGGHDVVAIVHGDGLRFAQTTLDDTLRSLSDRPSALAPVLHAGAVYQAALIENGTSQPPGSDTSWAYKAGAFDASVLNANDLHSLDDFNAQSAQHQLVTGFLKDVVNDTLEIDNPVAGAIVHNGIDAGVDKLFPGPDPEHLTMSDAEARSTMQNSLHAAITAGYYRHGYLADAPPPPSVLHDGRLVSYSAATGDAHWDWEDWMNGDSNVHSVTVGALQEVSRAYAERGIDLIAAGG